MIPDDVLLETFDFYVHEDIGLHSLDQWMRLVHVCRRWRSVVFQSPLRLNLQLVCTPFTPAKYIQDIWPPLPIIIREFNHFSSRPFIEDNMVAALEHNDRVREIELRYPPKLEYFANSAAILKPFPELTLLVIRNIDQFADEKPEVILPDSFMGGFTPRLRTLVLQKASCSGLPKLLLSTTHLVDLELDYIHRSGYIPPEVMATSLSALTSLEFLSLRFYHPPPRPALDTRPPPPPPPPLTRSILPSLTRITFTGTSEYMEVILAWIDSPRLYKLDINFFNQIIFDTPQLCQFISRRPTLREAEKGHITFDSWSVTVHFPSQTASYDVFNVRIGCSPSDWQLSSIEQFCTSLPPISTLEDLYIFEDQVDPPSWQDDVENSLWQELLHPFSAVKNLYISEEFVPRIAPALQELVGGRTTQVLPVLGNIFLDGFQPSSPLQEGIEKFVAARRLISHPVGVSRWDRDSDSEQDSESDDQ
jgi:hypothetical protein